MTWLALSAARWAAAALAVAIYVLMCAAIWRRERRARAQADALARTLAGTPGAGGHALREALVVHASQTGAAEQLAWQTAQALHGAGVHVRVLALGELTADDLLQAGTALFVASTCGEGDAPDSAIPFVRRHMSGQPLSPTALAHLQVGVLALGDREFTNFCAFGRRLSDWLDQQGARPLFYRIEADALDAAALTHWQHEVGRLASLTDVAAWAPAPAQPWTLVERRHLNPGSPGAPVFHLQLAPPADAATADWESGDLVQVQVPGSTARPREYSIASTPSEGRVHLLVRQERRTDGLLGLASGWLTRDATIGAEVPLTLRPHRNFRLGDNAARPLVLVGNGTGIAGLRAHLRHRADAGAGRNWLVFGERQRAHDFHFRADVEAWQSQGMLERVDLAFSRDQAERVYVQHLLRHEAGRVRDWLDDGAAIYVCGSAAGMAAGVEDALVEIAGRDALEALIEDGRYRRDVY